MTFDLLPHDDFWIQPNVTLDSDLCRNWTQGTQNGLGCTYNTPIKAWSNGVSTLNVDLYISRLHARWVARIYERNLLDPRTSFIATNQNGLSLPDAQHFCVRPLVDVAEMFQHDPVAIQCGKIALQILQAYFIQAKVPYFRDGGSGPFGYSGRSRIAGWGLAGYADAVRLFRVFRASDAQWKLLLEQIARYFAVIKNAYPLVDIPDGPTGDHLNVPHVCAFNGGVLARGLISLMDSLDSLMDHAPDTAPISQLAARVCEEMAQAYVPDQGFWYDLPYRDGKPMPADGVAAIQAVAGKRLQTEPGSTHVWCASPFTIYVDRRLGTNSAVGSALDWQRKRAVEAGRDPNTHEMWVMKKHPVEMVKSFEGWTP